MIMLQRLKFHLKPLVDQMLDQLPPEVFTSPTTTFLDPAMAGGQFLREVITRLRTAGHSDDNIRSRIWGCEILNGRLNYCRRFGGVISDHLIQTDFLSYDWGNMKFDVILGNPPYQSTEAVGKKLWPLFVEQGNDLCKQNGYLCMVTPATWMDRPQGKSMKSVTKDVMLANNLKWITTCTSEYFSVGEKIAAWVVHKSPNTGEATMIKTPHGNVGVVYTGDTVSLTPGQKTMNEILRIMETKSDQPLRDHVYNDVVTSISIDDQIEKKMIFDTPGKTRVPLFWTASNTGSYYLDKKLMRPGIKVILNKSGYYYSDKEPDKYMLIDSDQKYAIGAGALGITCDSLRQAKNMISFLKSKLYQFYINNEKTSGFNTGIIKLAMLSTKQKWTDQTVYDHFGLTPAQITFVENNYQRKYHD